MRGHRSFVTVEDQNPRVRPNLLAIKILRRPTTHPAAPRHSRFSKNRPVPGIEGFEQLPQPRAKTNVGDELVTSTTRTRTTADLLHRRNLFPNTASFQHPRLISPIEDSGCGQSYCNNVTLPQRVPHARFGATVSTHGTRGHPRKVGKGSGQKKGPASRLAGENRMFGGLVW